MDDLVAGPVISAVASIAVAVISKAGPERSVDRGRGSPRLNPSVRPWIITSVGLSIWFLISPGLLYHDLVWQNFLLIPFAVVMVSLVRPIKPLMATSITLALFAVNWIAGPWSNRLAHSNIATIYPTANHAYLQFVLLLGCGSAALAFMANLSRGRVAVAQRVPPGSDQRDVDHQGSIASDLDKLAHLYGAGVLTDDEFSRAKAAILRNTTPEPVDSRTVELAL